jgi:hypothetical protein
MFLFIYFINRRTGILPYYMLFLDSKYKMTNPRTKCSLKKSSTSYNQQRRIFTYLQNVYTHKTNWFTPLPWKASSKLLFDQAYIKDVRLYQTVHYDSLYKQGEILKAGNHFIYNLLNMLNKMELRLVTIEGSMGSGKSVLALKFLKDWLRTVNVDERIFLFCDLSKYQNNSQNLDLNSVMNLFGIPMYLYEDFMWLIEKNAHNIVVLIETNYINLSARLIFKLFYKVFPVSKFVLFYRPDYFDVYQDLPKSQEYRYLLRRRIKFKISNHTTRQTLNLFKQVSTSSIIFQNFRDTLYENADLKRLCTNPFVSMVVLNLYKETKGMKFVENKLLFFRKILLALWKRYS